MSFFADYFARAPLGISLLTLALAFVALGRFADLFVVESVTIAEKFHVPKLVIGLVLVSLATTVPEVAVSLQSALDGKASMALGNAMGSIACNTGIALALCGMISARPIPVAPRVLRSAGGCLVFCLAAAFVFVVRDRTLTRGQGAFLLAILALYLGWLIRTQRKRPDGVAESVDLPEAVLRKPLVRILIGFAVALAGIILASRFVLFSALAIARALRVPESVIALTLVALGTSIPEVATSISAARRGHGEIAVGNILGANIMNICWVAGAVAIVRPLTLSGREMAFMFPSVLGLTLVALFVLRSHAALSRREGAVLLGGYLLYLGGMPLVLPPGA